MKILIANTLYFPDEPGGAEISTRLLAEGLVRAGIEVCVVCATGTGADRVDDVNGVKVYRLRSVNLYWPHVREKHGRVAKLIWHAIDVYNVIMSRKLSSIIAREKPDVISTSNLSCLSVDIWRLARNAGVPIVHTARDYYLMCPTAIMFSHAKPCERQCGVCSVYAQPKRVASARVAAAVGVSRFVLQKHLESGYFSRATRTAVIYNACESNEDSTSAQRTRRYQGGPVRLGLLGRVSREKGLEVLLEQLLADNTLQWTLAVGGHADADYLESIKAKYDDPRVEYLGRVNPDEFFDGIDILVVPSIWNEPFGRVTVEAYSHGVPVVGANTGGIPEVIEPRTNLAFDMARPSSIIGKLHEAVALLEDPGVHDRMREYARRFNVDAMVDAYRALYESVLAEQAIPRVVCP
ncbi:group 1 glycosyl transferase [Caballeronia turbans]|uniref:glycosyltransferase family 4 protein n=1 Tax=unclassified Caballeronia TaxID=2646786 RepID=UPI00074C0337|nr:MULTISPECIES: glycosyltransferase family 4 protein [unclassified Caballeronia]SAL60102.1 group 1 glycosyl transferase [Caballeronia turbans]